MAKTEGTQSIPAPWLDSYRATLGEQRPNLAVHKRYPWRLPNMQAGKSGESAGQRIQRARFITVRDSFKNRSQAERARWYANMPPWSSLLWYYNYFIMSGLMDILGANPEGAQVIASINHYTFTIPGGAPADITVNISEVNPAKSMAFFYGGGPHEVSEQIGIVNFPYLVAINATTLIAKGSNHNTGNSGASVSVIEYI